MGVSTAPLAQNSRCMLSLRVAKVLIVLKVLTTLLLHLPSGVGASTKPRVECEAPHAIAFAIGFQASM